MKNSIKSALKKKFILIPLIVLIILFALYIAFGLFLLHSADASMRKVVQEREEWVEKNKSNIMYIFNEAFPEAKECNEKTNIQSSTQPEYCKNGIRQLIDNNLSETLGYPEEDIGRLPIFFIRLKDENHIEKIYQSGDFIIEDVDTKEEREVVRMLEGQRDPFTYPQYTCCGGDDILPDIPILNLFLPTRIYLKDFYAEIEHILLIRNVKDEIVGGLVYLYGD